MAGGGGGGGDCWWEFAIAVQAVAGAGGRPEAGEKRVLGGVWVGFGGYFQNSGAKLPLGRRSKRSIFFRVVYPVFTGCRPFFGDWRLEIGDWRLEIGDWRLEIGDWRLEIRGSGWR
jgi:hypothetical protein